MDFINKNLSSTFKIIVGIVFVLIFVRIIPILVVVGFIAWIGYKVMSYFKLRKHKKFNNKKTNMDVNSTNYHENNSFDFSDKNIIDVEYEEIKK